MKNMKKLCSVLLALVMVLTMAVGAFAEGTTNTITVKNAVKEQEYKIYKMLDLSVNDDKTAFTYTVNSGWTDFFGGNGAGYQYVTIDTQGYVTEVKNVENLALAAEEFASNLTALQMIETTIDGDIIFKNLDPGYYLITSTLGTKAIIDTTPTDPNPEIEEKNEAPTVTKEVQEDSNSSWGESNDADVNQIVNFKATITVQKGAENYVLHDTMSAGLTYTPGSVEIAGLTKGKEYTVNEEPTDGCTFEVAFDNEYIAKLEAGTQIVVTYSATLNEDAVVGGEGNPNTVVLQYGDKAHPTNTPPYITKTYTWDMNVVKFTKNGEEEVKLANATFKLSTDDKGESILKFHALGENKYEICADANCNKEHKTEITTDATGTFCIEGLDSGTYYLTETAAPAGYNKLAAPVTVVIESDGDVTDGEAVLEQDTVKVENKSGTELPSTGGMGTTLLYVVGGVLFVGAAVLLITKRRMNMD